MSSTSALVNVPGAADRIAGARRGEPDLPIGLHLNITTGCPILPPQRVPSMVDARGVFHRFPAILPHVPAIAPAELRAELWAQAEMLLACGVRFDHIDFHHHLPVLYGPFGSVVRELAQAFQVPVRCLVPSRMPGAVGDLTLPVFLHVVGGGLAVARRPQRAVALLRGMRPATLWRQRRHFALLGIPMPDRFFVGYSAATTLRDMAALFRHFPVGVSELMVHPGYVDGQLSELGGTAVDSRAAELALLMQPAFRQLLADADIQLVGFDWLRQRA